VFLNLFRNLIINLVFLGSNRFLLDTQATLFIPSVKLLCSVGKTSNYACFKIANKVNLNIGYFFYIFIITNVTA